MKGEANKIRGLLPEKERLLERLRVGGFNVPGFIYVPAEDFEANHFELLETFLKTNIESYKVIARSAHPQEEYFRGGTFDSLETYSDVAGIQYARKRIIKQARTARWLSILRQQIFHDAPQLDMEETGVIVMPYITGSSVMAKQVGGQWEFGVLHDSSQKFRSDPYITNTPSDRKLLDISQNIQSYLGFAVEIEYIIAEDGEIFVVQAKDISRFDTDEILEAATSVILDGIRRIRRKRNYRERPVFVMDTKGLYIDIIGKCEEIVLGGCEEKTPGIEEILAIILNHEKDMEEFALRHERFGVLALSLQEPKELFQVANHYLDDTPDLQKKLSKALHEHIYRMDYFLSEADTLISNENFRVHMGTHDAYGVDTLRNPLWSLFWSAERHDTVVRKFQSLPFKTGDLVGIDIGPEELPTIYRL